MVVLRASLFRSLQIIPEGGSALDLGSPTTRALLAYILLHREQETDRRYLAYLFWPRGTESAARRNLRQYLHRIRRLLDDAGFSPELLLSNGSTIQINPQVNIWTDVGAFRQGTRPQAAPPELESAICLYTGDLLEDIYEDWCQVEREDLRQGYLSALERLARSLESSGSYEQAILYTQKRVDQEPLAESAHQDLMRLYALTQDRHRASLHYQRLEKTLAEELGTAPLPQTTALLAAIQNGEVIPPTTSISAPPLTELSRAEPDPAQTSRLFMVGREAELGQLTGLFQKAIRGQSHFVLITGESGIGKTRLANEYLQGHLRLPILHGICHELDFRTPFAPFREALQKSFSMLPGNQAETPPWVPDLAPIFPALAHHYRYPLAAPSHDHRSGGILHSFAELILSIARQNGSPPLHLVLDNLQWADSQTWELLTHLSRHVTGTPLVILGLCRLEDLPPEHHHLVRTLLRNNLISHLSLARLSQQESTDLASQLLQDGPPDDLFFQRLYQETEGNPFFIIETIRALHETGHRLGFSGRRDRPGIPARIQQVVEARLDLLPESSRDLLVSASVIGREFTFSFLAEISQETDETIIGCLEEWTRRGLVREFEDGYDFSHEKIRQVTYGSLSRARRQYTHRQVAEALENTLPAPDVSTLAYHFTLSDQPLRAMPYLIEAGEQALRARSYREAQQVGLQALNLLGSQPGPQKWAERIDLNLQLAQVHAFTNNLRQAQEILNATERLAVKFGDDSRLGQVFRRSSQIFWLRGYPAAAGDYARRALRVAEELNDHHLLLASLRMLGRVGIAQSNFDDAIAHLMRYIHFEESTHRPPGLPAVHGYLGVAYARVGSWQRSLDSAERGVQLAQAEGLPQTVSFAKMQLAFVLAERREWRRAWELLQSISNPLQDDGYLTPLGFMILGLRGRALGHLQRAEEGIEIILPALDWAKRSEHHVFEYLPRIYLVECLLEARRHGEAGVEAERALDQAGQAGDRWALGYTMHLQAEVLTRQRQPAWLEIENRLIEARNLLRQVRARPALARTYLALRRLYDRAGQIAWAVDCHFRATTIFEELGMDRELQQAQGRAAGERRGAVVIPNLNLRGPNQGDNPRLEAMWSPR